MYRANEATFVGDVIAAKWDRPKMLAAAIRLWVLPRERDDLPDEAVAEVWRAFAEVNGIADASAAALSLVRGKQRIRAAAFIDLCESLDDLAVLLELGKLVVDETWPIDPYLGAVFVRLVELEQERAVKAFIDAHLARIVENPDGWNLVAHLVTCSRVGSNADAIAWFEGWERRSAIPMWILASYEVTIGPSLFPKQRTAFAQKVRELSARDETLPYFVTLGLIDDLLAGRDDDFLAKYHATVEERVTIPDLEHPMMRFVNALKRKHPFDL